MMSTTTDPSLARTEIYRLVNAYIGVSGGYLGDFSYRTHAEFYPEFCGLDINPSDLSGTTPARFIQILQSAAPADQAKIVQGILRKYPVWSDPQRTQTLHDELLSIARRLEGFAPVPPPSPAITTATVDRAIADAETLIRSSGATSGVDRVHTSLHGYLIAVCDQAGISYQPDPTMTSLLSAIRQVHPKMRALGPRAQDVTKVLRSFGAVLDALQPVRNRASLAHPNATLLDGPEAMLCINAARTVLHYLDSKIT